MLAETTAATPWTDLNWAIERQIMHRTWGRIRYLHVDATPERIFVAGIATSYYLKQLALAAVLETLSGTSHDPAVHVEIEVNASKAGLASEHASHWGNRIRTP